MSTRLVESKPLLETLMTADEALEAFTDYEQSLEKLGAKNHDRQKTDIGKANAISVAEAINNAVYETAGFSLMYDSNVNLAEIALTYEPQQSRRKHFEKVYLYAGEALSSYFNYAATWKLHRFKLCVLQAINQLYGDVLMDKSSGYCKKLGEDKTLVLKTLLRHACNLIKSAPSFSAVMASLATVAHALAQSDLQHDYGIFSGVMTDTSADLFRDEIPRLIKAQLSDARLKDTLNPLGAAYQLQLVKDKLLTRLKAYVSERAVLLNKDNESIDHHCFSYRLKSYFFYNETLQGRRVEIAQVVLSQLERMKTLAGQKIDSPQMMVKVLMQAIQDNDTAWLTHGRFFDGQGQLSEILDELRFDIRDIYSDKHIRNGSRDEACLYQQLGFDESEAWMHRYHA